MGGLALMMVDGRAQRRDLADVNRLLDAAFATLAELGDETFAAFVRDEIGFRDFLTFMRRTAKRHPTIYDEVFAQLTRGELWRWTGNLGRLAVEAHEERTEDESRYRDESGHGTHPALGARCARLHGRPLSQPL